MVTAWAGLSGWCVTSILGYSCRLGVLFFRLVLFVIEIIHWNKTWLELNTYNFIKWVLICNIGLPFIIGRHLAFITYLALCSSKQVSKLIIFCTYNKIIQNQNTPTTQIRHKTWVLWDRRTRQTRVFIRINYLQNLFLRTQA